MLPESVLRKTRALRAALEQLDLGPAATLRHGPGVPGITELHALAQLPHQHEHALPFRKNEHLHIFVVAALRKDLSQFLKLGTGAVVRIEDEVGVADHAHHGELALQLLRLLLSQRTPLGDRHQARHLGFMIRIGARLRRAERNEVFPVGAVRQLRLDVGLAAAQQKRLDALVQPFEITVTLGPPALVEPVKFAIETEQRPEHRRFEKRHDGVNVVDSVFDGRSGEHERVAALQPLDGLRRLGAPVLDALRFVQDHHIRLQLGVDVERVGDHLLVIDDGKERRCAIKAQALAAGAEDQLIRKSGESFDLLLPLGLQ